MLTLDRPPANALDESLISDLSAALDDAGADDRIRAVVLTGSGSFFSGGFDLRAPRRDERSGRLLRERYSDANLRLLGLPKPTVAMAPRSKVSRT